MAGALSLALSLWAAFAMPAFAEGGEKAGREREALRRVQQSLRETQAERDTLQADQLRLQKEKDALTAESAKLQGDVRRLGGVQAQLKESQGDLARLRQELDQCKTQLAEAQGSNSALSARLAESSSRLNLVRGLLERSTQAQAVLEKRNQQLYNVGLAAVELFRSRDLGRTWIQQVNVLGFDGVRIDDAAEQMRTRLDEARYLVDSSSGLAAAAGAQQVESR